MPKTFPDFPIVTTTQNTFSVALVLKYKPSFLISHKSSSPSLIAKPIHYPVSKMQQHFRTHSLSHWCSKTRHYFPFPTKPSSPSLIAKPINYPDFPNVTKLQNTFSIALVFKNKTSFPISHRNIITKSIKYPDFPNVTTLHNTFSITLVFKKKPSFPISFKNIITKPDF